MPHVVTLPDGSEVEFPDEMGDVDVQSALKRITSTEPQDYLPPLPPPGTREFEGRMLRQDLATERGAHPIAQGIVGLSRFLTDLPGDEPGLSASLSAPIAGTGQSVTPLPPSAEPSPLAQMAQEAARTQTRAVGAMADPFMAPVTALTTAGGPLGETLRRALGLYFGQQALEQGSKELGEASVTRDPTTAGAGVGNVALGAPLMAHPMSRVLEPASFTLARELSQAPLTLKEGQPTVAERRLGFRLSPNALDDPRLRGMVEQALQETEPGRRVVVPGEYRAQED